MTREERSMWQERYAEALTYWRARRWDLVARDAVVEARVALIPPDPNGPRNLALLERIVRGEA